MGGAIRGCLYEDGCHKVETGQGCFPPVSMPWRPFAGELSVTHCRIGYTVEVEAEALTGPQPSIPALDILVTMLLATHIMQLDAQTRYTGMSQPGCPLYLLDGPSQPEHFRLWPGINSNATKKLDSHGQLASLFCPAIAYYYMGMANPFMSCP